MAPMFDPRRWARRDQATMVLGIILGAVVLGVLAYLESEAKSPGEFVSHPVRHRVLIFCAFGAVLGGLVTYFQGLLANDVPRDYP